MHATYSENANQTCLSCILEPDYSDVHLSGPKHPQQPIPHPREETCHVVKVVERVTELIGGDFRVGCRNGFGGSLDDCEAK